jgi:hypothetical protein
MFLSRGNTTIETPNDELQQPITTNLFIKYQQSQRKEGNHKNLQLVDFLHPNNSFNNGGQMHNQVDKTSNMFNMLMR